MNYCGVCLHPVESHEAAWACFWTGTYVHARCEPPPARGEDCRFCRTRPPLPLGIPIVVDPTLPKDVIELHTRSGVVRVEGLSP